MVSLARRNLFHDRLRFVITVAGVAFAVTLVLVQVGLFLGLLGKATVTIEHAAADVWITSHNTPNVDFAHTFPETVALRARGAPGVVRADNLIVAFMNIQLPSGATEGSLVYALEDAGYWRLPWRVTAGDPADLRRGDNVLMDRSAELRYGALFTVVDLDRLRIEGEAHEADAHAVALGAEVAISAEGYPERTWRGRVEEVPDSLTLRRIKPQDPSRPTDVRVLAVKVAFAEPVPLKLGTTVDLRIAPGGARP